VRSGRFGCGSPSSNGLVDRRPSESQGEDAERKEKAVEDFNKKSSDQSGHREKQTKKTKKKHQHHQQTARQTQQLLHDGGTNSNSENCKIDHHEK
jgi:hypothetical protein